MILIKANVINRHRSRKKNIKLPRELFKQTENRLATQGIVGWFNE